MSETAPGANTGDHPDLPAGYTYLGQFLDHDITFDPTTLSEARVDPLALRNFRTPALDLDSLYGAGPIIQPYLYQRDFPFLFQPGATRGTPTTFALGVTPGLAHDLPRTGHGFAVIADPRNDENLIIGQLHLAFLLFHNKVVEGLERRAIPRRSPLRKTVFEEARDLVTWHYQWIVLHDFLPRIADASVIEGVRSEGSILPQICAARSGEPFIPVEFSAAAYRFGHSMVNSEYDYNRVFNHAVGRPATLQNLFDLSGRRGGKASVPIPSDWIIDWRRFFQFDTDMVPGKARLIDPYLSSGLKQIAMGANSHPIDLAVQNLKRGNSLGLPPGQSIARYLGYHPLCPSAIADSGPDGQVAAKYRLHIETPLWYYILKEAQLQTGGTGLGDVGSRIVAEVLIGLVESDQTSFLAREPDWQPTLGPKAGEFTIADLLAYVGDLNPVG